MNILLVKLSSLGDVLHNLPIVWDIRQRYPDARIDWVVEEGYVELLEPLRTTESFKGIDHIIPIGLRRWVKKLKRGEFVRSIEEFVAFKDQLQETSYDVIIETQGLVKSAMVTRLAHRAADGVIAGLANRTDFSGYEPLARRFYTESVQVPKQCHAVDRSRWVASAALDIPLINREEDPPHFYPESFIQSLKDQSNPLGLKPESYVLCFHATARAAKCWDVKKWIAVGQHLTNQGLTVVLPWGSDKEKKISETIAAKIKGAVVPKAFSIQQAFVLIAQAKMTLGVDTGLTHLSAVLNKPTTELYIDSPRWKTEGYWNAAILNLGDKGEPPLVDDVLKQFL